MIIQKLENDMKKYHELKSKFVEICGYIKDVIASSPHNELTESKFSNYNTEFTLFVLGKNIILKFSVSSKDKTTLIGCIECYKQVTFLKDGESKTYENLYFGHYIAGSKIIKDHDDKYSISNEDLKTDSKIFYYSIVEKILADAGISSN